VVESLHLTQGFLGVTLLAIVPSAGIRSPSRPNHLLAFTLISISPHEYSCAYVLSTNSFQAEYLNAVQFAFHNNMPLALEIGASSAIQVWKRVEGNIEEGRRRGNLEGENWGRKRDLLNCRLRYSKCQYWSLYVRL